MILIRFYPFLNDNIWNDVLPAGKMLHIVVTIILGYNAVKLTSIQKRSQLSKNVFVLEHILSNLSDAKLQIQVRSLESHL